MICYSSCCARLPLWALGITEQLKRWVGGGEKERREGWMDKETAGRTREQEWMQGWTKEEMREGGREGRKDWKNSGMEGGRRPSVPPRELAAESRWL